MPKKQTEVFEGTTETIEEFLARGGKIEKCPAGQRTLDQNISYTWKPKQGQKKKKAKSKQVDISNE